MRRVVVSCFCWCLLAISSPMIVWAKTKNVETIPKTELEISFKSEAQYQVDLIFFSQIRNREWPGNGKVYTLHDDAEHLFSLTCKPKEKICWGAAVRRNSGQGYGNYWGVGIDGKEGCSNCCITCGQHYGLERLQD